MGEKREGPQPEQAPSVDPSAVGRLRYDKDTKTVKGCQSCADLRRERDMYKQQVDTCHAYDTTVENERLTDVAERQNTEILRLKELLEARSGELVHNARRDARRAALVEAAAIRAGGMPCPHCKKPLSAAYSIQGVCQYHSGYYTAQIDMGEAIRAEAEKP